MSAVASNTEAFFASRSSRDRRLLEDELAKIAAAESLLPQAVRVQIQAVLESIIREDACTHPIAAAQHLRDRLAGRIRGG